MSTPRSAAAHLDSARARLRRREVRTLLYAAYPGGLGEGLLSGALSARQDLDPTPEKIRATIDYLVDRAQVTVDTRGRLQIATLTTGGVDAAEAEDGHPVDRVRAHRMLRLRCLQALSYGHPGPPLGLDLLSAFLADDTDLDTSSEALTRALAYLTAAGLAVDVGNGTGLWRIHADGVDYLAGDGDGVPGVARPGDWIAPT